MPINDDISRGIHSLFHLTKYCDRYRVKLGGLRVALDARKVGRIWLCELNRIADVSWHLTERDGLSSAVYALFAVNSSVRIHCKRCGRAGIYYVESDIHPNLLTWCSFVHCDGLEDLQDEFEAVG